MYACLGFISRLFISLIFIVSGISKIFSFNTTMLYMQNYGMKNATPFLVIAIIVEIVCGLSILLGLKARYSAIILFVYLIIVTCIFHLHFADPQQIREFLKNLAILGGLLLIMLHGSGPWSMRSRDI